jgi:hypothetical protein
MSRKLYLHQIGERTPKAEPKKPINEIAIPFQYLVKNLELMTKQRFELMNSRQRGRFKWWAKLQNFTFDFVHVEKC